MSIESGIDKPIFKNLQALRGIAALMVCSYHFSYLIPGQWGAVAFSHGWLGVQIFFMISGFIMVKTTSKINSEYVTGAGNFLKNRIIRIVPLYYLCTFLMIAPALSNGYLAENGSRLIYSLLFISPMNNTTGPEYGMPSLDVGWSLNYEMLFYALFSTSILFKNYKYYFLFFVFLISVFVIPFWHSGNIPVSYEHYFDYQFEYLNLLTNPILLHFVVGITFGLFMHKITASHSIKAATLILSSLLFIIYFTGVTGMTFTIWNDLIFCGILVFSFLLNDFGGNGFQFKPAIIKLGDMSYSIYLLHPIVIIYLKIIAEKIGWHSIIPTTGFFIFAIVAVVAVSYIFYELIETKLTWYLKIKFSSKK